MLPQWSHQEIQRSLLFKRRQTEGRDKLFWDMGSCCTVVKRMDCCDLGLQVAFELCPMKYHCCFYPQTKPGHWKHICTSIARGFHHGRGYEVLCLKKTLYGLKQSPPYYFHDITDHPVKQGLLASQFDPCLFISGLLIINIYVDDLLIFGKSDNEIDDLIA